MNKKTNVDQQEVAKFDALADTWWDPTGPMKPLHQLNPLRLAFIQEHAALMNQTVCDIGCGAGILTESLAREKAITTGLDQSKQAIQAAIQHAKTQSLDIQYHCESIESFSQTHAEQFDVFTCMEMLEHVPDPAKMIEDCASLLKPGGICFFSTINRKPKAFLQAIIGAEYIMQLLPKGTHHYRKFIRPSELNRWAEAAGLKLVTLTGIHYHLFSDTFDFTNDVSVNYLTCYVKNND